MGTSGGSTQTTSTQKPEFLQNLVNSNAIHSYNAAGQPYQPFEGQRFAPLNSQQQAGLNMTEQRAMSGSPVMNAANADLQKTLEGGYLSPDSNPFLQNTVNQALGDVQSRVNSQFSGNNFGSTAHQEWLGRNLADTALPIYNQNYQQERGRQMQANLFAPQAAQSDYQDLQALLGVGDVRQAQAQQGLDFNFDQFNAQQQDPYNKQQWLSNILNGTSGQIQIAPNPYQQNRTANAIGGAAAGAGLGGALGGAAAGATAGSVLPGWGTAIGAGVGLLGGLFG